MKKLAIITTHPIQYYAPVFKLLNQRGIIAVRVFYTWGQSALKKHDPGFDKPIEWDIPLLDGYSYEWVTNASKDPGSHHFKGIINPGLIQKVKAYAPDAILVVGWAYNSHLKVLRYFKNKIPVYFRGDSTLLNEPAGIKKIFRRIFLKWVYRHVDHAFYVGTNNKAYYKKYGLKDRQLSFAPHAIDNNRFEIRQPQKSSGLRTSLNIKPDEILVLYAGKFEPGKNVELLLAAFILMNKTNVHLLMVGNGINEQNLKTTASGSQLVKKIHFLPFKNQAYMPVLYQAADLFCLPSVSETWGLSINEAMACATAVLVSNNVGCAIDLVKPGANGDVFLSGDLSELTGCLDKLTASEATLEIYGNNAADTIAAWSFLNTALAIENKINETRRQD